MSFNEQNLMNTAASNLIDASQLKSALRDIFVGDPQPSVIEQTLRKYCSPEFCWQTREGTYTLLDLIPHIRSWRLRVVDSTLEITHLIKQGNVLSTRHLTCFTRVDGTICDVECFQFITFGEDGLWLSVFENLKVVRNIGQQRSHTRSQPRRPHCGETIRRK